MLSFVSVVNAPSAPSAELDADVPEPAQLASAPTDQGSVLADAAQPAPQPESAVSASEARGVGPRPASTYTRINGRSDPVASPERIPTAPGALVGSSSNQSGRAALVGGHPLPSTVAREASSSQPKAMYRGQTLIYVERGDQHDVVDAHFDEYLRLRRRAPRIVRLHSTLREMRSKLFSEGALI